MLLSMFCRRAVPNELQSIHRGGSRESRVRIDVGLLATIAIFSLVFLGASGICGLPSAYGAVVQTSGGGTPPQAGPVPSSYPLQPYLTDLTMSPPTIQMSWNYPQAGAPFGPPSGPPGPGVPTTVGAGLKLGALCRNPGGAGLPFYLDQSTTYFDDQNWSFNVHYEYYLTGIQYFWNWNATSSTWVLSPQLWRGSSSFVTVCNVPATVSQSVDSRIDPRYSTYVLKNHQFGAGMFRGGLYAAYNGDGANVGRSYLKFTGLTGPLSSGEQLWQVGGVNLYCTRLAQTGSANLVCRTALPDTWDPSTIVWGNAPSPALDGLGAFTVSWDSTAPAGQWVLLQMTPQIQAALAGDGTMSVVVMSSQEGGTGGQTTAPMQWAYFGKTGYAENGVSLSPYLLYAYGGPGALGVSSVTVSPTTVSVSSGGSATVTVNLNANVPAGGATVSLASSSASVSVPASLSIPGGSGSGSVTVSGTTAGVTATITATLGGSSASGTVTVGP